MKWPVILIFYLSLTSAKASEFYIVNGINPEKITINESDYNINGFFYSRSNSKKLAITVHGLFENCSYISDITKELLDRNFEVLCLELPGHGMNYQKPLFIKNFNDYAKVIDNKYIKELLTKYQQTNFIAHSTGTLVFLNAVRYQRKIHFDHVILVAPLITTKYWLLSKIFFNIASIFTDSIERGSAKNPKLLAYKNSDKKLIKAVTTDWYQKLINWNNELAKDQFKNDQEVSLILAQSDEVVDNQATKKYYSKHFKNLEIIEIKKAEHRVHIDMNQSGEFYRKLFQIMK